MTADIVNEIYQAFPRKAGKQAGLNAIRKVILDRKVDEQHLLEKTKAYAAAVEPWRGNHEAWRFVCHCSTWFNQHRFDDDPAEWTVAVSCYPTAQQTKDEEAHNALRDW